MNYPLSKNSILKKVLNTIEIELHPAIHTYTPVSDWIFEHIKKQ